MAEAAGRGQINPHDDDVGPQPLHHFQRFDAVRRFADHVDPGIGPKQSDERRPIRRGAVGDQNLCHRGHRHSSRAMVASRSFWSKALLRQ
jgi:hypothetical protein